MAFRTISRLRSREPLVEWTDKAGRKSWTYFDRDIGTAKHFDNEHDAIESYGGDLTPPHQ